MSVLDKIPLDIWLLITSGFGLEDLHCLRSVSKGLDFMIRRHFGKQAFSSRSVMLSHKSLEALVAISQDPDFSDAVTTLTVCIDHLTDRRDQNQSTDVYPLETKGWVHSPPGPIAPGRRRPYHRLVADQDAAMSRGHNTAQLTQALAECHNLRKIKFGNEIKPWGGTALIQESGVRRLTNIIARAESVRFAREALRSLVSAMSATKRPWDELQITPCWKCWTGLPARRTLDLASLASPPPVTPILLESLKLSCYVPYEREVSMLDVDHLLGFIALFSGIQRLVLDLDLGPDREGQCAIAISQRLRLPNLRILCLKYLECTETELTTLFLGHKETLEKIHLCDIRLRSSAGGGWKGLLTRLRDEMPIRTLVDYCTDPDRRLICYCPTEGDRPSEWPSFSICWPELGTTNVASFDDAIDNIASTGFPVVPISETQGDWVDGDWGEDSDDSSAEDWEGYSENYFGDLDSSNKSSGHFSDNTGRMVAREKVWRRGKSCLDL